MSDWQIRAQQFADDLAEQGVLRSAGWQRAVARVPRHEIVPTVSGYNALGWESGDTSSPEGRERWLSQPSLMARMLEALDIQDGDTVLDIGTGSGYNAALLCERLGHGHVVSIDRDPNLVIAARDRLANLGYHPLLASRDEEEGLPEGGPYDRIFASCSVRAIPWSWVLQTRVGGLILAEVKGSGNNAGNLVRLRRYQDRAEGYFDAEYCSVMAMGHADEVPEQSSIERVRSRAEMTTTSKDLRHPWENPVFWWFAHLQGLDVQSYGIIRDPEVVNHGDAFMVSGDSWCEISKSTTTEGRREVWQGGPRRLWNELKRAHDNWERLGQPSSEWFGMTVTEKQQTVWLDSPDADHYWVLLRDVPRSTTGRGHDYQGSITRSTHSVYGPAEMRRVSGPRRWWAGRRRGSS